MIRLEGVSYSYDGERALDEVSLSVEGGEFVVLAGANGSGKTTLVRHCNGLLTPDEGTVTVDGVDVPANPVAARTSVGMVFQNPRDQFVATTVRADVAFGPENLGLDPEEIDGRVERALSAVGLDGRADAAIETLSGGERARAAIAGALAMEPSYLVLDEPFAGLDAPARRSVLDRIDTLHAAGTAVVVVTHDLRDLLERADRVVALADGTVAFDCDPETARGRLPEVDVRVPERGC